jgi:hypothetical protein
MATPTIRDLLPPRVRQWTYALLIAANGGYLVAEAAYEVPTPVLIGLGVVNAAGFTLARSNV